MMSVLSAGEYGTTVLHMGHTAPPVRAGHERLH